VNIACSITDGNGACSINKKTPHTHITHTYHTTHTHTNHRIVLFDVDIDLHPVGNCSV